MAALPSWHALDRCARAVRSIARSACHPSAPLLAHIVPVEGSGVAKACGAEHGGSTGRVPLARVEAWLDRLAGLRATFVTCVGDEPLRHPDIGDIVAGIRARGMMAGVASDGALLDARMIELLNEAGLDHLELHLDARQPAPTWWQNKRLLAHRLETLALHATFHVDIRCHVGPGTARQFDIAVAARTARTLGLSTSLAIPNEGWGRIPFSRPEQAICSVVTGGRLGRFQRNAVEGRPNQWTCRAGARYLYIAADGLVRRCPRHTEAARVPIELYAPDDTGNEAGRARPCSASCTLDYVYHASRLGGWLKLLGTPLRRVAPLDRQPGHTDHCPPARID